MMSYCAGFGVELPAVYEGLMGFILQGSLAHATTRGKHFLSRTITVAEDPSLRAYSIAILDIVCILHSVPRPWICLLCVMVFRLLSTSVLG